MAIKKIGVLTSGGDSPGMSRLKSSGISLYNYTNVLKTRLETVR